MTRQKIPGVAVRIVNKGTVTTRGYGFANVEHMVPVTDETIFQSGSLGKIFTATAVMQQAEDGKLALSDPLTKFFSGTQRRGTTWRRLTCFSHTSSAPVCPGSAFDYWRD